MHSMLELTHMFILTLSLSLSLPLSLPLPPSLSLPLSPSLFHHPPQTLTFYELDLGLNHVVRKYSEPLEDTANHLIRGGCVLTMTYCTI